MHALFLHSEKKDCSFNQCGIPPLSFFLPKTALVIMGAMLSITLTVLELKEFTRLLTETEGTAAVDVKAWLNNAQVFRCYLNLVFSD